MAVLYWSVGYDDVTIIFLKDNFLKILFFKRQMFATFFQYFFKKKMDEEGKEISF